MKKEEQSIQNLSRFLGAKFRESILDAEKELKETVLPVITFSRETGAGGVTISSLLAGMLEGERPGEHWGVFDNELVSEVIKTHNLPERVAAYMTEAKPSEIRDLIGQILGLHPAAWTLVEKTNETIRRLANSGNVILVGRGSHCVTRKLTSAFHVRLVCPFDKRVERLMETSSMGANEARGFIEVRDRERRDYVRKYFGRDVGNPLDYHLVVNTGLFSDAEAAKVILRGLQERGSRKS